MTISSNSLEYVEKSMLETLKEVQNTVQNASTQMPNKKTKDLEKRITELERNTMSNFLLFEKNTHAMLKTLYLTMMKNLNNLNTKSAEERNEIIDWTHNRAHLHEDILKTRITACAYDRGHFGAGVVTYNRTLGEYLKDSVSFRVYNKTDINPEDVLNRQTGVFKVPEKGIGEYMFTFTVTTDSIDHKLDPSAYFFMKNGERIEGTNIDRVPGSRTIFLKLWENDKVSVNQEYESLIQDCQISFCGALLHLARASESPGGLYADASNPSFPYITEADQDAWEYVMPTFKNIQTHSIDLDQNNSEK